MMVATAMRTDRRRWFVRLGARDDMEGVDRGTGRSMLHAHAAMRGMREAVRRRQLRECPGMVKQECQERHACACRRQSQTFTELLSRS